MAEDSIPYGASHDDNGNRVCTPLTRVANCARWRLENDSGEGSARIIEFSFTRSIIRKGSFAMYRCGYRSIRGTCVFMYFFRNKGKGECKIIFQSFYSMKSREKSKEVPSGGYWFSINAKKRRKTVRNGKIFRYISWKNSWRYNLCNNRKFL